MKSHLQINMIVAMCEGGGIGRDGTLPWRLKSELSNFSKLTKAVSSEGRLSAVVMGRKTWDSIPSKFRPLPGRLNVVVSRKQREEVTDNPRVEVVSSYPHALALLRKRMEVETAWIIGGASLYQEALASQETDAIFLTEIYKDFNCDTFFPTLNREEWLEDQCSSMQEEDGVTFQYKVFKRKVINEGEN